MSSANNNIKINKPSGPMNRAFFESFFQGWLCRQHDYLHQLTSAIADANLQKKPEHELNDLVSQVISHYQQYYVAKASVTCNDNADVNNVVFMMFSPPWFSSFEHSFLWIAGFKPSLAFKVLNSSVHDMSDEQKETVGRLTIETKNAEKELNNHMAMIQESLARPPISELARGRRIDGEITGDVNAVIQVLKEAIETLVKNADLVRMTTSRKVLEILSPAQAVRFLAAATQLQLKIRTVGWRREATLRRGGGGCANN